MKKLIIIMISALAVASCNEIKSIDNKPKDLNNKNNQTTGLLNNENDAKQFMIKKYGIPENSIVSYMKDEGLYQFYIRGDVVYLTKNGEYLIPGHLIKTVDGVDITKEYIEKMLKINPKEVPVNLALKQIKGNGKNIMYVFSDPDCPYCHMFNSVYLPFLDNVTIYTFLVPLPMHENAESDSLKILCSKNPIKTFESWMTLKPSDLDNSRQKFFDNNGDCISGKNTLNQLKTYEQKININGTPTVFNQFGKNIPLTSPMQFKADIESK